MIVRCCYLKSDCKVLVVFLCMFTISIGVWPQIDYAALTGPGLTIFFLILVGAGMPVLTDGHSLLHLFCSRDCPCGK